MRTDIDLNFLQYCSNTELKELCDLLTHDENGEIRFTLYIKNNIGFFSGEILSYGYFFADEPEIDYSKTGTVILNHKNESIKAKRRAISSGRDYSRDIFAVKINDLNKIDINTLSITIFDFYYIEYTRK